MKTFVILTALLLIVYFTESQSINEDQSIDSDSSTKSLTESSIEKSRDSPEDIASAENDVEDSQDKPHQAIQNIEDMDSKSFDGTVVVLSEERLVVILKSQAWYYLIKNGMIYFEPNSVPKHVKTTYEKFPESITGSINIKNEKYYFFRRSLYCVRRLGVGFYGNIYIEEHEEEEETIESNKLDINSKLYQRNDTSSSKDSNFDSSSLCIWKQNKDLFGCPTNDRRLQTLCNYPWITGAFNYENGVYILTHIKVYKFDGKYSAKLPFGNIESNQLNLKSKWQKFDPNYGGFFVLKNMLYVFKDDKHFDSWNRDGIKDRENQLIQVLSTDSMTQQFPDIRNGASVVLPHNRIAIIVKNQAWYYKQKMGQLYKDTKMNGPVLLSKTQEKFPHSISGSFTRDLNVYYFIRGTKYCVRRLIVKKSSLTKNLESHQSQKVYKTKINGIQKLVESHSKHHSDDVGSGSEAKSDYSMCSWRQNTHLLGCFSSNTKKELLNDLCAKPPIIGSILYEQNIYVLISEKFYIFDGDMRDSDSPLGSINEFGVQPKDKWKGFDATNALFFVMENRLIIMNESHVYSSWNTDGNRDKHLVQIVEESESTKTIELNSSSMLYPYSPGTAVVLPNNRIAVVIKDQVWYYKRINNKIYKDSEDMDPKQVNTTVEDFPPFISSALTLDFNIYYFFRGSKYCKRPLIVGDHSIFGFNQTEWEELYEEDENGNRRLLNRTEVTKTIKASEEDSHCIWRNIMELFGCETPKISLTFKQICSNPITIGTIIYDRFYIYVFIDEIIYIFGLKLTSSIDKTDESEEENDPTFTKLISIMNSFELLEKWKGFDPNLGRFFAIDNYLCNILDNNKYNCWLPNGKHYIIEEMIEEYEIADEMDGDMSDSGALIMSIEKEGRFLKVIEEEVCYYLIRDNKCYQIGKCTSVYEEEHNFPPNIIAAIKTHNNINNIWYYFDKNGKYCSRPDQDYSHCTEWKDNEEVFGCLANNLEPQMRSLCKNVKIKAGANYPPYIYVFRGGKYWQFNNFAQENKPFGDLVLGAIMAKTKWSGIHFPGGISYYEHYFVMILKNKWLRWKSNGGHGVNQLMVLEITEEVIIQLEEDPDGDSEALLIIDKNQRKHVKIDGNHVCFVTIRNGRCYWSDKCLSYNEEDMKYPPKTIGAIRSHFNNWFIFDKNAKFCKRAQKEQISSGSDVIAFEYP